MSSIPSARLLYSIYILFYVKGDMNHFLITYRNMWLNEQKLQKIFFLFSHYSRVGHDGTDSIIYLSSMLEHWLVNREREVVSSNLITPKKDFKKQFFQAGKAFLIIGRVKNSNSVGNSLCLSRYVV